jgi:acyl-CoA thioesterase
MAGLWTATALHEDENGATVTLDPSWDIWGPAGGYIAAIALRAVGRQAPAGHRPLTLTGQFVSRASPGALEVDVQVIKPGGTSLFAVRLAQKGQLVFLAQIWTSARNAASIIVQPMSPQVPPPDELPDLMDLFAARGVKPIAFWDNVEGRPVNFRQYGDPLPDQANQYRWMRFRDWPATTDPFLDAIRTTMLIDIGVWPGHWHRVSEPPRYGAPSLDIAVHFHDGAPGGEWLLSAADTDVSGNGSISGRVRIFADDGRVLATGSGHCLVVNAPA